MMYEASVLTLSDMVWMVEVACKRMIEEEVKRPELFNRENLYRLVAKVISDGTGVIVKADGVPVGGIGGVLSPNLFNPNFTTLAELMWYIEPDFRTGRAALLGLNLYLEIAEKVADEATMSLLPSSNVGLKQMEKKGFIFEELAFRKTFRR